MVLFTPRGRSWPRRGNLAKSERSCGSRRSRNGCPPRTEPETMKQEAGARSCVLVCVLVQACASAFTFACVCEGVCERARACVCARACALRARACVRTRACVRAPLAPPAGRSRTLVVIASLREREHPAAKSKRAITNK
eukprot:3704058-Pleurochrysis_carterae.AAC.1